MAVHATTQRSTTRVVVGVLVVLSTMIASFLLGSHAASPSHHGMRSTEDFLATFVSPRTAKALTTDKELKRYLVTAVDISAEISRRLAERYADIPEWTSFSNKIAGYQRTVSSIREPGTKALVGREDVNPFSPLEDLLQPSLGDLAPGGIQNKVKTAITDTVDIVERSLLSDVAGAAMFLGVGIGGGVAEGSTLATPDKAKQVAMKVATDNGNQATGLNPAIMNAALGVTASLVGAVDVQALIKQLPTIDVRGAALGLSTGIGNGVSSGLKLSTAATALQAPNGTSIGDIAGTFGFGLTKSVSGNLDLSKASFMPPPGLVNNITGGQPFSAIALSLAQGLGTGATMGLKLTNTQVGPPTGTSAADTLGAFGFGLVNSVTGNLNTSMVSNMLPTVNTTDLLLKVKLAQTLRSFGTGLGAGAAAGLNLTKAIVEMPDPAGNDAPAAAGNFAFGLTKSVTENIELKLLMPKLQSLSSMAPNVDVGRAAQGVAMGFIQGAGDAINSMGGLQALVNGTAKMPMGNLGPSRIVFNDSIGGGAVGLGQGIGGQGTLVGVQLISQLNVTAILDKFMGGGGMSISEGMAPAAPAPAAPAAAPGAEPPASAPGTAPAAPSEAAPAAAASSAPAAAAPGGKPAAGEGAGATPGATPGGKPAAGEGAAAAPGGKPATGEAAAAAPKVGARHTRDLAIADAVARRQEAEVGAVSNGNSFNLSIVFNAGTISSVAQRAVDTLSCAGVGGLALIGLGLYESGTISADSLTGLNVTLIKQILPRGVIHITSGGNNYRIDGVVIGDNIDRDLIAAAGGVNINGMPVIRFASFLTVHILLALLGFILLVPLAISLESVRNVLVRLQMTHLLTSAPGLVHFILVFAMTPIAFATIIFGFLSNGDSGHFRTFHAFLGFLTALVTIGAAFFHIVARGGYREEVRSGYPFPTDRFSLMSRLTLRTGANQSLLMLVIPTVLGGFADLSSLTLCITRVVPFEGALAIATLLSFLYSAASALSSLTMYLAFKDYKKKSGGEKKI